MKHFLPWALGFALLCAPLIYSHRATNLSSDEATYYLPAVDQIRPHWPALDLVEDSLSATAPGYPWFLAGLSLTVGHDRITLRWINWAVSLGVLLILWSVLRTVGGSSRTLFLLPLAIDNFFLKSAGFVVTDNAALLLMACALIALLDQPTPRGRATAILAATLSGVVRQINIWLVAPLALRLFFAPPIRGRWRRLGWLLVPVVPLAVLIVSWGGVVPPVWQTQIEAGFTVNFMALLYLLTVMTAMGAPFYLALSTRSQMFADLRSVWSWGPALLIFALALITPSLPDVALGHWGGYWWNLAAYLPTVGHASLLFVFLAPAGAWLSGAIVQRLQSESQSSLSLVYAVSLLAWMGSTMTNRIVFHRYYEPPLLVFLILWAVLLTTGRQDFKLVRTWPLAALIMVQGVITIITVHAQALGLVYFG